MTFKHRCIEAPQEAAPWVPNGDLHDMLVRVFAPREVVTTKPNEPERLEAIWEEWGLWYFLMRSFMEQR